MKKRLCATLFTALATVGQAQADTLTVGAGWSSFLYISPEPELSAGDGSFVWEFTLTKPAYLDVTDAFTIGDVYSFFNNGTPIGTTGAYNLLGPELEDPDLAFGSADYSWGRFLLQAGSYNLTGVVTEACCVAGSGFLRLSEVEAVPEPDSWALMIAGFGLVGAAMRRRALATA